MTDRDKDIPTGESGSNFGEVDPGTTGGDVEHLLANAEVGNQTDAAGGGPEGFSGGDLGYGTASGGADVTGGTGAGDNPNDVDAGPENGLDSGSGQAAEGTARSGA